LRACFVFHRIPCISCFLHLHRRTILHRYQCCCASYYLTSLLCSFYTMHSWYYVCNLSCSFTF
jgi:hypothetical protein